MKKYELYKIIIISPAPDRVRRAAACRVKPLMAFIETADQTSQHDYRPIVIAIDQSEHP